jgi:hypothetical protein
MTAPPRLPGSELAHVSLGMKLTLEALSNVESGPLFGDGGIAQGIGRLIHDVSGIFRRE